MRGKHALQLRRSVSANLWARGQPGHVQRDDDGRQPRRGRRSVPEAVVIFDKIYASLGASNTSHLLKWALFKFNLRVFRQLEFLQVRGSTRSEAVRWPPATCHCITSTALWPLLMDCASALHLPYQCGKSSRLVASQGTVVLVNSINRQHLHI